jgi:uncharacterized membrane protein (DUF106 family)
MVMTSFLDPVFNPLLALQPWAAILLISAVLTLLSTLVYKWTTPQKRLKDLKKQLKEYQDKIKKMSRDNPKKAMEVQKKAMELNMEYMKHSFKPMLYTFIPIILIFGWLQAHMAYEPVAPGVPFEVRAQFKVNAGTPTLSAKPDGIVLMTNKSTPVVDKSALWTLKGNPGIYKLSIVYEGETVERDVFVTNDPGKYESPSFRPKSQSVTAFNVKNEALHPLGSSFNIFGWYPGWIGYYIILSMIFSFGFRRLLNLS